jgi:hypothetical protein
MRRDLVAAVRRLSGDEVEEDALSRLLHRLFPDRIAEKQEMLRRVSSGSPPLLLPPAEVDPTVEIPSVIATTTDPSTPRRRGGMLAGLAAVAFVVLGAVVVFATVPRKTPTATVEPAPQPIVEHSASAPVASTIRIRIETVPGGAKVVAAGSTHGITPLNIDLPRGDTPVVFELTSKGYVKLVEKVIPNADQKLVLHLDRMKPAPAPIKATAKPSSTIGRFD